MLHSQFGRLRILQPRLYQIFWIFFHSSRWSFVFSRRIWQEFTLVFTWRQQKIVGAFSCWEQHLKCSTPKESFSIFCFCLMIWRRISFSNLHWIKWKHSCAKIVSSDKSSQNTGPLKWEICTCVLQLKLKLKAVRYRRRTWSLIKLGQDHIEQILRI